MRRRAGAHPRVDSGGHARTNRLEPPCTDPYARWCGRGRWVTAAPMPIKTHTVTRFFGSTPHTTHLKFLRSGTMKFLSSFQQSISLIRFGIKDKRFKRGAESTSG